VQRRMVLATTIWPRFGARPFNAAVLAIAMSVSGWTQQAQAPAQKHEAAGTHAKTIEYKNTNYGFSLSMPESWKGYRLLWSEWEGNVPGDDGKAGVLRGPKLEIRHPKWTQENPYEDMPIMIFTIAQWNKAPDVSAAPFGPGELGRNRKYVFAVPPRWDYDFSEGYEEAEKILTPASFYTFAPGK